MIMLLGFEFESKRGFEFDLDVGLGRSGLIRVISSLSNLDKVDGKGSGMIMVLVFGFEFHLSYLCCILTTSQIVNDPISYTSQQCFANKF